MDTFAESPTDAVINTDEALHVPDHAVQTRNANVSAILRTYTGTLLTGLVPEGLRPELSVLDPTIQG